MRPLSHHNLQARSAYQPVIHQQGDRWIAYVGHHGGSALNPMTGQQELNGTSIVDVTDPRNPKYLYHLAWSKTRRCADGAGLQRQGLAKG
jgi:hypothetical protein